MSSFPTGSGRSREGPTRSRSFEVGSSSTTVLQLWQLLGMGRGRSGRACVACGSRGWPVAGS